MPGAGEAERTLTFGGERRLYFIPLLTIKMNYAKIIMGNFLFTSFSQIFYGEEF